MNIIITMGYYLQGYFLNIILILSIFQTIKVLKLLLKFD